jgi:hyperosmotically inducible periplasmic protein
MKAGWLFSVGLALLVTACAETDPGITTAVKSRLAADDTVKARSIDVDTQNGAVTLTGEVRSAAEEAQALQIARGTDGVTSVVDQLTVVPEAASTTGLPSGSEIGAAANDVTITATVKSKLLADPDTSGLRIEVDTKDRMVTLSGEVKSAAEKTEALQIARDTDGVVSVTDRLTVRAN